MKQISEKSQKFLFENFQYFKNKTSTFLTLYKLFQNPINISIKEEANQIIECDVCCKMNKTKTKNKESENEERGYRTLLSLFLPTHLHQFNKFLRTI
jgi:hypothetical protein